MATDAAPWVRCESDCLPTFKACCERADRGFVYVPYRNSFVRPGPHLAGLVSHAIVPPNLECDAQLNRLPGHSSSCKRPFAPLTPIPDCLASFSCFSIPSPFSFSLLSFIFFSLPLFFSR